MKKAFFKLINNFLEVNPENIYLKANVYTATYLVNSFIKHNIPFPNQISLINGVEIGFKWERNGFEANIICCKNNESSPNEDFPYCFDINDYDQNGREVYRSSYFQVNTWQNNGEDYLLDNKVQEKLNECFFEQ